MNLANSKNNMRKKRKSMYKYLPNLEKGLIMNGIDIGGDVSGGRERHTPQTDL
jgi:hypothetical protein